ncbi:MAG: DMT family transporter [Betaproteobacteria bacterium]|nr:DMT family transporter [Betaproteobacteria bacterium]
MSHTLNSTRLTGVGFILLSAACFAVMPVFGIKLYAEGLRPTDLLWLRFSLAALLLWGIVLHKRLALPRGRALWVLGAMGGIGYTGQSLCYFSALQFAPAAVVALLLYLYPACVTLLAWLVLKERVDRRKWLALVLALAGCVLTVGYASGAQPLGLVLGTGAAVIYACYIIVGRTVPAAVPALMQATLVCSAAALVMTLLTLPQGPRFPVSTLGWGAALALALLGTVVAVSAFLAGLARLGAANAATLSTVEPVLTALAGALLLGQPVGLGTLAGGGLILIAALLITLK